MACSPIDERPSVRNARRVTRIAVTAALLLCSYPNSVLVAFVVAVTSLIPLDCHNDCSEAAHCKSLELHLTSTNAFAGAMLGLTVSW